MSNVKGLGFGGLLVGFGAGWIAFDAIRITSEFFGYFLLIAGGLIVASSLMSWKFTDFDLGGLTRGLMIGLLVSLIATSGFDPFVSTWGSGDVGSYRADDTRLLSGDLTADAVLLDVDNFNGPVKVSTWDRDEYSITIIIRAKGFSDAEAQANLADIEHDLDESVLMGKNRLVLRHNVSSTKMNLYAISVEAKLPAGATVDLDLDSSNGGITLEDVTGGTIDLSTSNGAITFDDVNADSIDVDMSNGGVRGSLEAEDTRISTSNGAINLDLPCTVTGDYELRTSNAGVDLRVSSSASVGFDLDLSTSNGSIDIDLPNLDYTRNTRTSKEAHTYGFHEKAVRITIDASTSNAGMDVDA